LIGESQYLERALDLFSRQYYIENPKGYPSSGISSLCNIYLETIFLDIVLLLSNALVLLNTDLYNKNNKKKMSKKDFIKSIIGASPDAALLNEDELKVSHYDTYLLS
jgi:Sec7-like guanine-nucleotide exchange factor